MSQRLHEIRFLLKRLEGPFWQYLTEVEYGVTAKWSPDVREAEEFADRGAVFQALNQTYGEDWPVFEEGTYSIEEVLIIR